MKSCLFKKISAAMAAFIAVSLIITGPAQAGLDEMIDVDKPYRTNLVNCQTEKAAAVFKAEPEIHIVRPGETLSGLAEKYGVSLDALAAANRLNSESMLYVGQVLDVPISAVKHTVKPGETLTGICRHYHVTQAQVLSANNLPNPDLVRIGQTLTIPLENTAAGISAAAGSLLIPAVAMDWPVAGRISSPFGIRGTSPHHGIDIAANSGELIKTPRAGIVSYAGPYGTYGSTVVIDHSDGIQTLYAHCSTLLVSVGEYVQKGESIARVGNTGRSTGPHLHWEVRYRGVPFDPQICVDLNNQTLNANAF